MNTWATILNVAGSDYKRNNTDWTYIVSRSTIDGKENKETTNKVIKPMSKTAFRRRIETLIGLAINGKVFVNPLETLENVQNTRALNKKKEEEKAAKKAAQATKAASEAIAAQATPAVTQPVTQTAEKPAQVKQQKQQAKKAKQQPVTLDATIDTLPAFDGLFDGLNIPGEASDTNADTNAA